MNRIPARDVARYEDPLAKALLPPPNETPSEREKRVQAQCEALRISKEIDERLLESKKVLDGRKKATKILLLGEYMRCEVVFTTNILVQAKLNQGKAPP
jgi:hypothetical protein